MAGPSRARTPAPRADDGGADTAPAAVPEASAGLSWVAHPSLDPRGVGAGSCPDIRRPRRLRVPVTSVRSFSASTSRSNRGSGRNSRAAGGRRALRPPDSPVEPQDAPLHPRRARRDLRHRPAQDGEPARPGAGVRLRDRPSGERCCSSAPRSRPATPWPRWPRQPACPTSTTAGSAACSPTSRRSTSASAACTTSSASRPRVSSNCCPRVSAWPPRPTWPSCAPTSGA